MWDISDYDAVFIEVDLGWEIILINKLSISQFIEVDGDYCTITYTNTEDDPSGLQRKIVFDYNETTIAGLPPSNATEIKTAINNFIRSGFGSGGATDLGIANVTGTTLDITSSTGNDATVPAATATDAGLLIATDKVKLNNTSGTNSGNETASTLGATINGASAATPNDTDLVTTVESSVVKKITWTNVKAFLKTYFDTLYTTTAAVATQITTALTGYLTAGTAASTYQPLGAVEVFATTDLSKASDNTYANDPVIQFPVVASKKYYFRMELMFHSAAAADFKFQLVGPASPTLVYYYTEYNIAGGNTLNPAILETYAVNRQVLAAVSGACHVNIYGVVHNGSNAGTVALQWAQVTSDLSASIRLAGSKLLYKQVD